MKIREIEAKSVLVVSKLPDADYVANPYIGCQFACAYCYASFMGRLVDEPVANWGAYVYVKINCPRVVRDQLHRWSPRKRHSSVLLSSVTDPYHGIEAKYRLTRDILAALGDVAYPGLVSILTKSPMVLRDVDLIRGLPLAEVGMTVTTTEDRLGRFLEVKAPTSSRRLGTLAELARRGIRTYAFVGPLLPHFRYRPELLDALFRALAEAGVGSVYVEHLNLRRYIRDRLWTTLGRDRPEVQAVYREASTAEHRAALDAIVSDLLGRYHLTLRRAEVLYHDATDRGQTPRQGGAPCHPSS